MYRKWNLAQALKTFNIAGRKPLFMLAATLALGSNLTDFANGQIIGGGLLPSVVGGVSVDAEGVARDVLATDAARSAELLRQKIQGAGQELKQATNTRHLSLKMLTAALLEAHQNHAPLSEEIAFMGGLTRIEYNLLYPEQNDIVLVGPAEGWKVAQDGTVVGIESELPVINAEDFVMAFAKLNTASPQVISCSIEPTKEGSERLQSVLNKVKIVKGQSPQMFEPAMREAFGPQQVIIQGVEPNSNIARVIFAADYQMKRIGMKLKQSPVNGLPSYVDMLRHANSPSNQSRWWMACNYAPVEKSEDALAWRIQGPGIKVLTEEEVVQSDGTRLGTGEKQPLAAKWADQFTAKIEELSAAEPAIGQLRNIMDLCVVAAIIRTHGLEQLAQCDLSPLNSLVIEQPQQAAPAPSTVDPQCSFVRAGNSWIVTTSGGVLVDPWSTVQQPTITQDLKPVHLQGTPKSNQWFWN